MLVNNQTVLLEKHHIIPCTIENTAVLSRALITQLNHSCDRAEDAGANAVLVIKLEPAQEAITPIKDQEIDVYLVNHWEKVLRRIENLNCPTLCIINTKANGLGMAIMLTTDHRIAKPHSEFNLVSYANRILPGMVIHRLVQQVGHAKSRPLVLTGKTITADEALTLGVIDEITIDPNLILDDKIEQLQQDKAYDLAVRRRLLLEATTSTYDEALGSHLAACDRLLRQTAIVNE